MPSSSDGVEQVKRPPGTSSWSASRATSTRSPFAPTGSRSTTPRTSSRTSSPGRTSGSPTLRDDAAIRPWLAQLTRNACVDRLRTSAREQPAEEPGAEATDATLERARRGAHRPRGAGALSGDCHEILDRFFARDESYRTIGEALDLPPGRSRAGSPAALASYVSNSREENPAPTRLEDRERHIRIRRRAPRRASERPAPCSRWVGSGCAGASVGTARHRRDRRARPRRLRVPVRLVADLETALAAAGYEPTDELVDAVRACLPELDQ